MAPYEKGVRPKKLSHLKVVIPASKRFQRGIHMAVHHQRLQASVGVHPGGDGEVSVLSGAKASDGGPQVAADLGSLGAAVGQDGRIVEDFEPSGGQRAMQLGVPSSVVMAPARARRRWARVGTPTWMRLLQCDESAATTEDHSRWRVRRPPVHGDMKARTRRY